MKKIALRGLHGEGKFALVDDSDFEWLSQYFWHVAHGYPQRGIFPGEPGSRQGVRQTIRMHQMIAGGIGAPQQDHRDRNPLNNQRSNLRPATFSQNMANRRMIHNKSGFRGVIFHPGAQYHHKPWQPYVQACGRRYYNGYYATAHEAAAAYNIMAIKHHGEFAQLNDL